MLWIWLPEPDYWKNSYFNKFLRQLYWTKLITNATVFKLVDTSLVFASWHEPKTSQSNHYWSLTIYFSSFRLSLFGLFIITSSAVFAPSGKFEVIIHFHIIIPPIFHLLFVKHKVKLILGYSKDKDFFKARKL